jgi:cytochrome c553
MRLLRKIFTLMLAIIAIGVVHANDMSTVEQKAATCFGCHGDKGKSLNPQWPSLAGQQSVYLVNQLNAFKAGSRINSIMQAQAANLTEEDINNFGAYFTVQEAPKAGGDKALAQDGKSKASMCLGCHGNLGEGNGQFPRLAGQQPDYLVQQLQNFKNGSRKNGMMQAISGSLSDADMKALAAYFGAL